MHTIWPIYILGLCSSWDTSRIQSPSEHLLTPALSPFGGPRPKPRYPEEVVYSPNDSCSHFTQCLFPPKVPQQHTGIISYSIWQYHSHLLYITFTCTLPPFILHALFNFTSSDLHGRLAALGSLCPIQKAFIGHFFGLFLIKFFCFGCFDKGPKHRNKPKKKFWLRETNRKTTKTDWVSVCFNSNRKKNLTVLRTP
jgi:hypothetical protein